MLQSNKNNLLFSASICLSPPRIPDSNDLCEISTLVKSEDKESLRLLKKVVLPKSRDVNLYDDEIKTKKIIGTKRRKGLEKEIQKARNQSRKKNSTPQVNGEFDFSSKNFTGIQISIF